MKKITTHTRNKITRIQLTGIGLLLVAGSYSCRKFVAVPDPVNQIVSDEVFKDDATATSAVAGLYSQIMSVNLHLLDGAMTVYPALSSDELYNTTTNSTLDPFTQNAIPANSPAVQTNIWRYGYNYIYQANSCIENLNAAAKLTAGIRQQLTGEMEFSRALCYFYLVNIFGDVPLVTTTGYQKNAVMARTPVADVYTQIITDLKDAQAKLNAAYPAADRGRPNKWTAAALLARVYLYRQQWQQAADAASSVINSGAYTLESDLNKVFSPAGNGVIWELMPVQASYNTAEGATFIPSSATVKPPYALTTYLLNAFEPGDKRKSSWLGKNTVSGTAYYYPYKYKVRSGTTKTEANIVLRLAEQYLIRAEAQAQLGNTTDALSDLNKIRVRAGLPALSGLNKQDCLTAIMKENRIEFFAEWGHRWFDLKRTGQADGVLGAEKTNWQPYAAFYPIPQSELLENVNLVQNPGY